MRRLKRRRKQEYIELEQTIIRRLESFLDDFFGERLGDMKKYEEATRKLMKEETEARSTYVKNAIIMLVEEIETR